MEGIQRPNERGDLGKYDEVSEIALKQTEAQCVAMLVLCGNQGSGFSVSCRSPGLLEQLPEMLEHMAANMRKQMQGAANS